MYATFRSLKTQPGKAAEVGALIESDYLKLISGTEGFISYTLVQIADDEVSSIGLFATPESAEEANATAQSWSKETLGPLAAAPLQAHAGTVLVNYTKA